VTNALPLTETTGSFPWVCRGVTEAIAEPMDAPKREIAANDLIAASKERKKD
jgi:hypothetical protein